MPHRAFRLLCYDFHRGQMSDFFVMKKRGPKRKPHKMRDNVIYLSDYQHLISDTRHGLRKQGPRSGAAAARKIVTARSSAKRMSLSPLPPRLEQDRRVSIGPTWQAPSDATDLGRRTSRFAARMGAFLLFTPDQRNSLVVALIADEAPAMLWFLDAVHGRTAITGGLLGIACPEGYLLVEPHDLRGPSRSRPHGPQTGALPASVWRTPDLEASPLRRLRIADLGDATRALLAINDKTSIPGHPARMLVENAVVDAARFSHIDARSSSASLRAAFDTPLLAVPSGLQRIMARRMRG